jgi:hypothetical protein
VSGVALVAAGIAGMDEEPAVKQALQAMFVYEMENQDSQKPHFKGDYLAIVKKYAQEWTAGPQGAADDED